MTDWDRLEREDAVATARLFRRSLQTVTAVGLVAMALPFLAPSADALGFVGLISAVVLSMLMPWWLFPIALSPRRGVVREGEVIRVITARGDLEVDLRQLDRVRMCRVLARGGTLVYARVSGGEQPRVVLSWNDMVSAANDSALAAVTDVAQRPGVVVSGRARRTLKLEGAGSVATRILDIGSDFGTFVLVLVCLALPACGYMLLLSTLPGW